MTTFAFPPIMTQSSFVPYSSNDEFSDFTASVYPQSIPALSFGVQPYGQPSDLAYSAQSSIHSYPNMIMSHDLHASQPASAVPMGKDAYSPIASPHEHTFAPHHLSTSSESGASARSGASSNLPSPYLHPNQMPERWSTGTTMSGQEVYAPEGYFADMTHQIKPADFIDPSLARPPPFISPVSYQPHHGASLAPSPHFTERQGSPTASNASARSQSRRMKASPNQSPYLHAHQYHPYAMHHDRRMSTASALSHPSQSSPRSASFELDDEARDKGMGVCPYPECGRPVKDIKSHLLTHQAERPEKCPIPTCEYHTKGFARKYDKNRHTLTHYKGTMVCGFCPGSGSAAEKSFNRADVFKRHLTSVHAVEQTPTLSKKKSPTTKRSGSAATKYTGKAGTCSTCHISFPNPQEFYDHLDDCVLRVVQQIEPSEAINEKHLTEVSQDKIVQETLERNGVPDESDPTVEMDVAEQDDDENASIEASSANQTRPRGVGATQHAEDGKPTKRAGLTWSKGGVPFSGDVDADQAASAAEAAPQPKTAASNGRRRRKDYPASWGCNAAKMKMKKRVLCVYDGQRRLWKDDMMLDQELEVRVKIDNESIPGGAVGGRYITDLDLQTLKRAEGIFSATEEERGPWVPDNVWDISSNDELGDWL